MNAPPNDPQNDPAEGTPPEKKTPVVNPLLSHHQQQATLDRLRQQAASPTDPGLDPPTEAPAETLVEASTETSVEAPTETPAEMPPAKPELKAPLSEAPTNEATVPASGQSGQAAPTGSEASPGMASLRQPVPLPVAAEPADSGMKQSLKIWAALALLGVLALGGVVYAVDQWILPRWTAATGSSVDFAATPVYKEGGDLTYAMAKGRYKKALAALDEKNGREALDLLLPIEKHYLRIKPFVLFHIAEAQALLGNEKAVQNRLNEVIRAYPNTFLETMAQYRLGQSLTRQQDERRAAEAFERVLLLNPKSSLGLGSHYYLGEMAMKAGQVQQARRHWRDYLQGSANGTFSASVTTQLLAANIDLDPVEHGLIGKSLWAQDNPSDALTHMKQAPLADVWIELAKLYANQGDSEQAKLVLETGLLESNDPKAAQDAVESLLRLTPKSQQIAYLEQLKSKPLKSGGDFVLWTLFHSASGAESQQYAKDLLDWYGEGRWAPETSWVFLRNDLLKGQDEAFLEAAETHLKHYPNSRSAPRVLFWKAKLLRKLDRESEAKAAFEALMKQYPYQYYAYRAETLLRPSSDRPKLWMTLTLGQQFPVALPNDGQALSFYTYEKGLAPVVAELIDIDALDDVQQFLYASDSNDTRYAPLQSWVMAHHSRPKSMRLIEAYLDELREQGRATHKKALYRLFYPLVYQEEVSTYAKRYGLDPLLVMALMRQESFFNPTAVSVSDARGLMQLLPSTAREVAGWEALSDFTTSELFEPGVNIRLGTRYLAHLFQRFEQVAPLAVGSYNGGPGAMSGWVSTVKPSFDEDPDMFVEAIPYAQSREYIQQVFNHYWVYQQLYTGGSR
ncbi:MAG: transglycosylase SLT domain-containing protein [Cyanobacteria bacterium HKST-UBA04]|nr:transglycosylase SLT domain-containing protein [Cyanobacteria bacterium HKST-UBA04]